MTLRSTLLTNPDKFIEILETKHDFLSISRAKKLDAQDPLAHTAKMFDIDPNLIPFAGHSLGPPFKPTLDKMNATAKLQQQLHAGHFPDSHPEGKESGHWFDCDRHLPSLKAAQQLLGFKEEDEFCFTANGLSENLGKLVENFYRPTKKDWKQSRTKILCLGTDFFSDQAVIASVLTRAIKTAEEHEVFSQSSCCSFWSSKPKPTANDEAIKIMPDEKGLYSTDKIIQIIKQHASKIQIILLPEIVFSTGQRLELDKIFATVGDLIQKYQIRVILDLAHSVGNRPINLESMPITAAVGCAYKHLSGYAGSGFGIYVNRNADLEKFPPIQGWKAAESDKVFPTINKYDPTIMKKRGAVAFRTSNPPPMALLPVQTYLTVFDKIGFTQLFNKSECLTRYLIAQVQHHLGDKIEIITPLDPKQRGATIALRLKEQINVHQIEKYLKNFGFEIDTRPPNILRMTAHYAYNSFTQIVNFVNTLKMVLENVKRMQAKNEQDRFPTLTCFPLVSVGQFHQRHTPVAESKDHANVFLQGNKLV